MESGTVYGVQDSKRLPIFIDFFYHLHWKPTIKEKNI